MSAAALAPAAVVPAITPLARHTLAWIATHERQRIHACTDDPASRDALRRWFAADWPLVVRRPDPDASADCVALGLPLPPSEGKRRLGFEVHRSAIARSSPPLAVADAAPRLPPRWSEPLHALARQTQECGVALRVYGSVAWQALTGLDYVHADSDVDLLWQSRDREQLDRVLSLIERWELRHGLRADGEFVLPDGSALAWREWRASATHAGDDRVLVKRIGALALVSRASIAAVLEAAGGRGP